jgi:DNA-directed RNA polymerase III subunit RPC1
LEDLTTHYDASVRNSTGGVVQFKYGDDGLDPACLEGDAQPIDFTRVWMHSQVGLIDSFCDMMLNQVHQAMTSSHGRALLPYEIMAIVNAELSSPRFVNECTAAFLATVNRFMRGVVARVAKVRSIHGLFDAMEQDTEWGEYPDLTMGATGESVVVKREALA